MPCCEQDEIAGEEGMIFIWMFTISTALTAKAMINAAMGSSSQQANPALLSVDAAAAAIQLEKAWQKSPRWAWERITVPEQLFNMLQALNETHVQSVASKVSPLGLKRILLAPPANLDALTFDGNFTGKKVLMEPPPLHT